MAGRNPVPSALAGSRSGTANRAKSNAVVTSSLRIPSRLSAAAAALAALAAGAGLTLPGLYRDTAFLVPTMRAQDLVVLTVVLPSLVLAMAAARRGSVRALLVWGGAIAFLIYAYATWAFEASFNEFFAVYVAVLALSVWSLITLLMSVDVEKVRAAFSERAPVRGVAWFLIVFMGLYALFESAQIVGFITTGRLPQALVDYQKPTSAIMALDLGFLFPAGFLAAFWLLRRQAWGYVLVPIVLTKAVATGTSVALGSVLGSLEKQQYSLADTAFFAVLAVTALAFLIVHLRAAVPGNRSWEGHVVTASARQPV